MKMMKKMEDSNINQQNLNEILEKLVFDDAANTYQDLFDNELMLC